MSPLEHNVVTLMRFQALQDKNPELGVRSGKYLVITSYQADGFFEKVRALAGRVANAVLYFFGRLSYDATLINKLQTEARNSVHKTFPNTAGTPRRTGHLDQEVKGLQQQKATLEQTLQQLNQDIQVARANANPELHAQALLAQEKVDKLRNHINAALLKINGHDLTSLNQTAQNDINRAKTLLQQALRETKGQ